MTSNARGSSSKGWRFAVLALVVSGAAVAWFLWRRSDKPPSVDRLRMASAVNNWSVVRAEGSVYLRHPPDDAEALVLVARAEATAKRFARALKLLAQVPTNSSWSPEARLREGESLRQAFRGAAAEQSFRQAIEQGLAAGAPQRVIDAARLGLIQLYATEARNDEARQLIWELYRTSPQPAAVLELLGRLDIEGAEPHEAAQELEKFSAMDVTDFDARRGLAHHYLVLGRAQEARLLAERCVQDRSESLPAWETLFGCLNDLGDRSALAEAIERVPDEARETAWYWKYKAIAAESSEQWEAAEASLRQALHRDPFYSHAHYRLGRLLHQLGKDTAESDQHVARARELTATRVQLRESYRLVLLNNQRGNGLPAELCAEMGGHYEAAGLLDGAAAWYRESLKRDPTNAKSRVGLARLNGANRGAPSP